jgi:hypothetical protein
MPAPEFFECEFCGTEIFEERPALRREIVYLNRLDRQRHSCEDFRGGPDEVSSRKGSSKRKRLD